MAKVIPLKKEQKQEENYKFTPLGLAVMDALHEYHTADEIAEVVGEPICVVAAMLGHLANHEVINRREEPKPEPKPQPKKGRRQS
jgi:hypothetical protein